MKINSPLVSIVIPVFNVEKYLDYCLESVKCQSWKNLEVIGVDDCSTDGSVQIFERYAAEDTRFRLIRHDTNKGLPSSRNSGLTQAKGKYIYFLDSDDWISPHAIEILLALALESSSDIAIGGIVKSVEGTGKVFVPNNHAHYLDKNRYGVSIFQEPIFYHSVISCNKLVRLDFIKVNNLYFSNTPRRFEDMLTYKWYLAGARISCITDITYYYRIRDTDASNHSIMQQMSAQVLADKLLAYADLLDYVKSHGFLFTEHDPLHSKHAMMNLPKALSWIIPDIFLKYREDEMLTAVLSARYLFSMLEPEYVDILPGRLPEIARLILESSINEAITGCISICRGNPSTHQNTRD